jgi:hypothetical protein
LFCYLFFIFFGDTDVSFFHDFNFNKIFDSLTIKRKNDTRKDGDELIIIT